MTFAPGYGETPVPDDELDALLPEVRSLLSESITKAAVYDLEQAVQIEVAEELVIAVLGGSLGLDELVADSFLRNLHRRLYGEIWTWAGKFRRSELNIGIAPERIVMELRSSFEGIRYRWEHTDDWTARDLGAVVHAEGVRIHPFVDGNGRSTRLHADLVYLAAQETEMPELFDWHLDKHAYVDLLRAYDGHRDPRELASHLGTRTVAD